MSFQQTVSQPKVQEFLNSVGRNSHQTERSYGNGLTQFQRYLYDKFPDQKVTLETVLERILSNEINPYTLLDSFVSFLLDQNLSSLTISGYMTAIRSYFGYYDIDIVPSKFKRKVRLPKNHREDEQALDQSDVRNILLACENRRLKPFLLVLASAGLRAMEASAMRIKDVDFSVSPTKVHVRKEYAKTRVGRDVYVSNEATKFIKDWLEFKYRERRGGLKPVKSDSDLVFSKAHFEGVDSEETNPLSIYQKIRLEFNKVLKAIKMDERKESMMRRKVTLHTFRRFVKTVISNQVSTDYSEWALGHAKSSYWTLKEAQKRQIYAEKCMKYLTFLDYSELEATGRSIELKLEQKDKELNSLSHEIKKLESERELLSSKMQEFEEYKKDQNEKMERIEEAINSNSAIKRLAGRIAKQGLKANQK
jgi:integrase